MNEKNLINERIMVLAGIKPMSSFINIQEDHAEVASNASYEEIINDYINKIQNEVDAGRGNSTAVNDLIDELSDDLKANILDKKSNLNDVKKYLDDVCEKNPDVKFVCDSVKNAISESSGPGGMINEVTKHKPHKKILNERMLGFAGIVPLTPIGFVSNSPSSKNAFKRINEIASDLSKQELYQRLPMLHSSILMELAENVISSPSGKGWDVIVEEIADEYQNNPSAKQLVNKTLESNGLK